MKKNIVLALVSFMSLFIFAGCQKESDKEAEKYKEQINELSAQVDELQDKLNEREVQAENVETSEDEAEKKKNESIENEDEDENEPVKVVTGKFLELTKPENGVTVWKLPVIFEGEVSDNAVKVVVTAKGYDNAHNKGYKDVYTLKDFRLGDEKFTYRAKPEWKNLNVGRNDFEFEVFFDDDSSITSEVYVNYIYDGEGEIAFDGCGEVKKYKNYAWFEDLTDKYNALGLTKYGKKMFLDGEVAGEKSVEEMCFAKNGRVAVLISSGSYCDSGYIYRYFTESGALEQAKIKLEGECNSTFSEFLKRKGNIIPVKAGLGDAGCMAEDYFDYDFIKNTLTKKKTFSDCTDDGEEGRWEYY